MSSAPILKTNQLTIAVGDNRICQDVNISINEGECHILVGPNGSGKSSLLCAIMGIAPFEIVEGSIEISGIDVTNMSVEERAKHGVSMAFQRPPALDGISVRRLAHAIGADNRLEKIAHDLRLEYLLDRDVNCGFSGGELKRWEVAKVALHDPILCLLDEPESGVDLEQVTVVSTAINNLLSTSTATGIKRGVLAITHTGFLLDDVHATCAHLMIQGRIVESANPQELFQRIRNQGYVSAA